MGPGGGAKALTGPQKIHIYLILNYIQLNAKKVPPVPCQSSRFFAPLPKARALKCKKTPHFFQKARFFKLGQNFFCMDFPRFCACPQIVNNLQRTSKAPPQIVKNRLVSHIPAARLPFLKALQPPRLRRAPSWRGFGRGGKIGNRGKHFLKNFFHIRFVNNLSKSYS